MLLLRIIDVPATNNTESNVVQVVLEKDNKTETFVIASYSSPITDNFQKLLAHYFNDCLYGDMTAESDSTIVEKLITFGQYLGDELLGEDHQMIKFKRDIEEEGYNHLYVQIESERLEFFKEYWEIVILFESKYVLSSVVEGFVRRFTNSVELREAPELHYGLHAATPQLNISHLFASDPSSTNPLDPQSTDEHKPLHLLVWVSRPESMALPFASSNSINMMLDAVSAGGIFDVDVHFNESWGELKNYIEGRKNIVHIFHYDGPVIIQNDQIFFSSNHSRDELIPLTSLAQLLVANRAGALFVDARIYIKDNQTITANEGLALIAQVAQQQGLRNIIGLAYITNPWFSQSCFQSIYTQIARGFSLAQAVVEARKSLQKQPQENLVGYQSVQFHSWSLLVHYGAQPVIFFDAPQKLLEDEAISPGLHYTHNKLFGFNSSLLPPLFRSVSDGQALTMIEKLHRATQDGRAEAVAIHGETGSGKTQMAYLICSYLAQKDYIDYAFYFNFSEYEYTRENILGMIAPLVDTEPGEFTKTEKSINQRRCCFVLDQLNSSEINPSEAKLVYWSELSRFALGLVSAGHHVFFVSEKESPFQHLISYTLVLRPLFREECEILATKRLYSIGLKHIKSDKHWDKLLEISRGNPWLLNKAIPLLSRISTKELTADLEDLFHPHQHGSLKHRFFEWQWTTLESSSQALLKLISSVRGLLLEMLLAVAERPQAFAPVKVLLDHLGCERQFSTYIEIWFLSGFVQHTSLGRSLDPEIYYFLEKKIVSVARENDGEISFLFNQWLCEAIRLLAQHLVKNPNSDLFNYLLNQRRKWVIACEDLWYKKDYRGFFNVKNAFDEVLKQAQLIGESTTWSLDLLERSPIALPHTLLLSETIECDGQVAWLALATEILRLAEAKDVDCIIFGAEQWRIWVEDLTQPLNQAYLRLFQQATVFLEIFYQSREQWHDCLAITKKAHSVYAEHKAWHKVIQVLKLLAAYSTKLGEREQTLDFENKIINDIPYEEAPPGFKLQNFRDILFARINRSDLPAAQTLLNELRKDQEAEKLSSILDSAQCEIYYQQENYLAALPHYAHLWCRALAAQQHRELVQLKSRLIGIEKKIGSEAFNACFEEEAPGGVTKPVDYISELH